MHKEWMAIRILNLDTLQSQQHRALFSSHWYVYLGLKRAFNEGDQGTARLRGFPNILLRLGWPDTRLRSRIWIRLLI